MSKTLELPDDVYEAVEREAAAQGITPAGVVAAAFLKCTASENGQAAPGDKPVYRTLGERLRGRIGVVSGAPGTEDYAQRSSEIYAEDLVREHNNRK